MGEQVTGSPEPSPRPPGFTERGRPLWGATRPGEAQACPRSTPLSTSEVHEVVEIIARGRRERHAEVLPERLQTRDWPSVVQVILALDERLGGIGAGWKIGAASEEVRRAEGLPSPSPGRIYRHTIFESGASLGPEHFINYRNCECEYAFELGIDFPAREEPYSQADARAGIETLFPVLELGDTVLADWYGASGYFGSCLDNGGGAALITGTRVADWKDVDLASAGMRLYIGEHYIKSGSGRAAMGHPVTSLTWLLNWTRAHGRDVAAGEVVSTGTCTGHLFAAPGDTVWADFGELGSVRVTFD